MGGPYQIPRNVKGEGRILYIFSTRGLIFTAAGGLIGFIFFKFFSLMNFNRVAWILLLAFAGVGFAIGTLKVPETTAFEITRKTGGEDIYEILWRWILFRRNGKKIYTIMKEEETKDDI